jgi:peptidoglycan/LPS O-acetylase OafA/YrhL
MIRPSIKGQRLVALFLLGFLLFNYPFLNLFAGPSQVWGIPVLYGYVFAVWALLIGLMALVVEKRND